MSDNDVPSTQISDKPRRVKFPKTLHTMITELSRKNSRVFYWTDDGNRFVMGNEVKYDFLINILSYDLD